jgi:hypothetical protein
MDAIKWVTNLKANGATSTELALKKAFEPVEVNQIILLSDGEPTQINGRQLAPAPPRPILDTVKGLNRLRGVKVNTFCFAVFQRQPGTKDLLGFMEDLAKENGGRMILVGGGGVNPPAGGNGS